MNNKSVIELNGKRYDALNGVYLGAATIPHKPAAPSEAQRITVNVTPKIAYKPVDITTPKALPKTGQRNMDGVVAQVRKAVPKPVQPPTIVDTEAAKPTATRIAVHTTAQHTTPHKPQTAHTLMRNTVKKPSTSLKKQANVQGTLQHKTPSLITSKTSAYSIAPQRLQRAQSVPRSEHVSRFSEGASHHVAITYAPIAVKPAPTKPVGVAAPAPQPNNKPLDIFEQALANATNFRELPNKAHFNKKVRRHVVSMASGILALFVIAGFLAYQNTPGLQVKVAGMKAGISTGLPNFAQAGFAYQGTTAKSGKVTIGFTGNGNHYQLTQQTTNWSADEMIEHVASTDASGTPNYSTVTANGNTVYRFNNTSATWVKDGNWYYVSGSGSLSDSQVKSLVSNI